MKERHLYLLALEVSPLIVGTAYEVLPSHCTLVHRFWSELNYKAIEDELCPVLESAFSPRLVFKGKEVFGPPAVTVNRIAETSDLIALHQMAYGKLNELDVEYTAPQWVGEGYKAHVTERAGISFSTNQVLKSEAVYLIEVMAPGHDKARFVRARFMLKDSS